MKIRPANQKVLESKHPELVRLISTLEEGRVASVAASKELLYGNDPDALCKRWLRAFSPKAGTLWAVSGFGYGDHIASLLEAIGESEAVVVIEPDIATFAILLAETDCSRLLAHPKLHLCPYIDGVKPFHFFDNIGFNSIRSIKRALFTPCHLRGEKIHEEAWARLQEAFFVAQINYDQNVKDSALVQENLFNNIRQMIGAPDIAAIKDAARGASMVLVGAGPSLDEAEDFLKEAAKRAIIITGNTSLAKLLKLGIEPDIVVAVDPNISVAHSMANAETDGLYLACSFNVSPGVPARFGERVITWATKNETLQTIRSRLGLPPASSLIEKGTVSASIISLANHLGIKKICMVGQDLALAKDGRTHTKDSYYEDSPLQHTHTEGLNQVRANNGEMVPITLPLQAYLRIIEEIISTHPAIEYRNIATSGAAIAGTSYCSQNEALEWLGKDKTDFKAKLQEIIQKNKIFSDEQLCKALEPTMRFAHKVCLSATKAAYAHEILDIKLAQPTYSKHSAVRKALKMADDINQLLDDSPRDYQILFEGKTKTELVSFSQKIPAIKAEAPAPHWASLMQNKEYYWALAEGAWFLCNELEKLQQSLKTTPADASAPCQ